MKRLFDGKKPDVLGFRYYSTLRENVIREVFKRPHRIVALEWNQYIFLSTSISTIYIVKSNELKEKNHQSIKSLHKL